jgi:hypothetical protein
MKYLLYQEKSQTRDDLLQPILDGAAHIGSNYESLQKATHAVEKLACLCIANAGGNFKQQAT